MFFIFSWFRLVIYHFQVDRRSSVSRSCRTRSWLFRLLRNAQILNDDFKPVNKMPWWKRGELADILATELNIQHTWKVFGVFWDMDAESLRGGFNKAKDHAYKYDFDEEIMDILR